MELKINYLYEEDENVVRFEPLTVKEYEKASSRGEYPIDYFIIQWRIKNLTGRLLTIVDAAMPDGAQKKSVKDLMRKELVEEFDFYTDLAFPNLDEQIGKLPENAVGKPVELEDILGA